MKYNRTFDPTRLIEQLKKDEGFSPISFWDNKQYTWGYGTKAPGESMRIDKETAEHELINAVNDSIADILHLFSNELEDPEFNQVRFEALVNMRYNLGHGAFRTFKKMIKHIKEGKWLHAAYEAKNSKWYKQVGNRAIRIVKELTSGEKQ
jgi:lysozyme